jgi:LBP / BPI / CETP family, C-terminal domain
MLTALLLFFALPLARGSDAESAGCPYSSIVLTQPSLGFASGRFGDALQVHLQNAQLPSHTSTAYGEMEMTLNSTVLGVEKVSVVNAIFTFPSLCSFELDLSAVIIISDYAFRAFGDTLFSGRCWSTLNFAASSTFLAGANSSALSARTQQCKVQRLIVSHKCDGIVGPSLDWLVSELPTMLHTVIEEDTCAFQESQVQSLNGALLGARHLPLPSYPALFLDTSLLSAFPPSVICANGTIDCTLQVYSLGLVRQEGEPFPTFPPFHSPLPALFQPTLSSSHIQLILSDPTLQTLLASLWEVGAFSTSVPLPFLSTTSVALLAGAPGLLLFPPETPMLIVLNSTSPPLPVITTDGIRFITPLALDFKVLLPLSPILSAFVIGCSLCFSFHPSLFATQEGIGKLSGALSDITCNATLLHSYVGPVESAPVIAELFQHAIADILLPILSERLQRGFLLDAPFPLDAISLFLGDGFAAVSARFK